MSVTPEISPAMQKLADGVVSGERRALGRAITLIESRKPEPGCGIQPAFCAFFALNLATPETIFRTAT